MFLDKIRETIYKYHLIEKGDNIICAVSGGADSVCLFYTMLEIRDEFGINVFAANVNHLIRGEESDNDSRFVKELCDRHGVECFYREYDVKNIARERKLGEEECGRLLRYEFFQELSKKIGNAKIATAHNLNDNAETVLFRLVRGTAAQGMGGIKHRRENIIRPLLDVSRKEIEEFLTKNKYNWCEDSTNKMPIYARNRIRLCAMPVLNEISNNAEEKIVSAAQLISDDNEFINNCADEAMKKCIVNDEILLCELNNVPIPVKRRVVANVFKKWKINDINAEKIENFIDFTLKDNGKKFDVNSEFYAMKSYDKVVLCKRTEKTQMCEILDFDKDVCTENWYLSVCVVSGNLQKRSNACAVFDADKILPPFTVTYRKDGDKIKPKGMSGTKKLSDIFTDIKLESKKRNVVPIVRKDDEIIYIGGIRQSSMYAVDENTGKFLIISYERGNCNE